MDSDIHERAARSVTPRVQLSMPAFGQELKSRSRS